MESYAYWSNLLDVLFLWYKLSGSLPFGSAFETRAILWGPRWFLRQCFHRKRRDTDLWYKTKGSDEQPQAAPPPLWYQWVARGLTSGSMIYLQACSIWIAIFLDPRCPSCSQNWDMCTQQWAVVAVGFSLRQLQLVAVARCLSWRVLHGAQSWYDEPQRQSWVKKALRLGYTYWY